MPRSIGRVNVDKFLTGLQGLDRDIRGPAAAEATAAGAKILVEAAARNAPQHAGAYHVRKRGKRRGRKRTPGKLKASLKVRQMTDTPGQTAQLIYTKDPIAHLLEFGHDLWKGGRKRNGKGHSIGFVQPKPGSMGFFRKAIEDKASDIVKEMSFVLAKAIGRHTK